MPSVAPFAPMPLRRLRRSLRYTYLSCSLLVLAGCWGRVASPEVDPDRLFTPMPAGYTGVDFENRLTDTEAFNVFTYRNYYNGGGVAIGDVDGDGLADLYLTANQLPNRLYLNRGDLRFEDVTDRAGVAGRRKWSTGVSMVDVNGDGRLDIYVCNAGSLDDRANELFVNQGPGPDGVPTFEEQAAAYGLDDRGYSTHAAFFDYDRDGDLDVYVVNNSPRPVSSLGLRNIRHVRDPFGGDRLYRNDPDATTAGGRRFTDVSEAAGIYGSEIGFGLGVTAGDVDGDGWVDLYISNDFFERDYLYLNRGDGTFREALEEAMTTLSLSSMGADMADVTNDGHPEIFVTDMLPETDRRLKTTTVFEAWQIYHEKLEHGYYHQLMRNTLQLNRGDGTFSEVSQIAGVAATDWSWGALILDLDNDGFKDIFVANGVLRDVIDQDFIDFLAHEVNLQQLQQGSGYRYSELIDRIPSIKLPNHAFVNNGDRTFTNRAGEWGLGAPSFSNGAAYGDLDNDGDLDLVVNNLDSPASVFRNESDTLTGHHHLRFRLLGEGQNRLGVGARVTVRHGGRVYAAEQIPTRGFQSSVDPVLTLGLGALAAVDTVEVWWPDGRVERRLQVAADQLLTFDQRQAAPEAVPETPAGPVLFAQAPTPAGLDYAHVENDFIDFNREPLLPKMLSTEGPRAAAGDVNGDGLTDLYLGGARDMPGALFLQRRDGRFTRSSEAVFEADRVSEDIGALFFDADGDGDLDLYVVSGGNEFSPRAPALRDRLYLNDGRGAFTRADDRLPAFHGSGSCVTAADYDGDGDLDLFVGGRLEPWGYGYDTASTLLRNDGGVFTDVTAEVAPGLLQAGMVTDALWSDYDGDGRPDLVVVGEWMPITIFRNTGGRLERLDAPTLEQTNGLWNRIVAADLDGDGDPDYVAGNLGRNVPYRASAAEPLSMLVNDFDRNGTPEQVISFFNGGRSYPFLLRSEFVWALPFLEERFPTHADLAEKTVDDIFTEDERAGALTRYVYTLNTSYVENRGGGTFAVAPLPFEAQVAPVYSLLADDFDGDGHTDLLLGGNFYGYKPDVGRLDASRGLLLRGNGRGAFEPVHARQSGVRLPGQIRDFAYVNTARGERLILALRNDAAPLFLQPDPAGLLSSNAPR